MLRLQYYYRLIIGYYQTLVQTATKKSVALMCGFVTDFKFQRREQVEIVQFRLSSNEYHGTFPSACNSEICVFGEGLFLRGGVGCLSPARNEFYPH